MMECIIHYDRKLFKQSNSYEQYFNTQKTIDLMPMKKNIINKNKKNQGT